MAIPSNKVTDGVVFLTLSPIFGNHNWAAHITNSSRESLKSN